MEVVFKQIKDSQITMTQLMLPSHSNFSGKIHGGYILSLMDQVAFACASKHSGNYCVTASVNKVNFLNPIEVGELLTLKASINYTGNTSMVVGVRVEAENIHTGEIKHCNSSYFTMVAKDKEGNSVAIPGIILVDKHNIRRSLRSIERRVDALKRTSNFEEKEFEVRAIENINTKDADFCPLVYKEGIVFVSERGIDLVNANHSGMANKPYLSLYYAKKEKQYKKPKRFSNQLSSFYHDGPVTISDSGNVLYFTRADKRENGKRYINRLQIFSAKLEKGL